jgi:cell division protein FtsL
MQFNRVKYLLISIIVLISIVVVLFVLNSLNKKYPVSIEIAPKGNYYLKIDNVKYNYYDKSIYDLTAGSHTIEISRQDYDTRTEKINIKKDMVTEIKIDMENNLSGLIQFQLSSQTTDKVVSALEGQLKLALPKDKLGLINFAGISV